MLKCIILYSILVVISVTLLLFCFYPQYKFPIYMFNHSNYAPTRDGFSGIKIKDLIQSNNFYSAMRQKTLNYLNSVYPAGVDSFKNLGDLELASFYNSLSYYYNCDFQYDDNWDALPCKNKYSLPYPPQGWFYNFYTYQQMNQAIIYSDSDVDKPELDLSNFGSGTPGVGFKTTDEVRPGPGMFFVNPRTIQRNVYFPNGLSMIDNKWKFVFGQKVTWDYPKGWIDGYKDHHYLEVTHTQPIPGMVQSLGWWWNCLPGSGIFLNVGKSLRVRNKLEAVYTLLKMMKKEFLRKWFKSDDIYIILFGFIGYCGYDNLNNIKYCNYKYTPCNEYCEPNIEGVLKQSNLPLKKFYDEVVRYQLQNGIKESKPVYEGIKKAIHAAIDNTDYRLNRISAQVLLDEPIFFLGIQTDYDTVQMSMDPNFNGFFVFEVVDLRIPNRYINKAKLRDYSDFIDINDDASTNSYKKEFVQEFLNRFVKEQIISVRDPLDIFNHKKVKTCDISSIFEQICPTNIKYDQTWYNFYCNNVPISDEYKCLGLGEDDNECILQGSNPSC